MWSETAIPRASANASAASISSGYAPKSSWIFSPIAPASTSASRSAASSDRAQAWSPTLTGHDSSAGERPLHQPRRLLEAGRDQRRHAARQRGGQQPRADRVDVAVDGARRRDQAVAGDRRGVRPDVELDPVADRRVPRPPDADDPAVLDPDVGLHDADRRVDDDRAGDDDVELRGSGPAGLRHPAAEVLRVAPLRLVAGRLAVLGDADPEVAVGEADPVAGRGTVPGEALLRREAAQRSPPKRTSVTSRSSPGAQRSESPAGRSRRKPVAASRSNTSRALTRSNG